MPDPPPVITCVDCGDDAHLLSVRGEVAAYRCSGCADRWDLVFPQGDSSDPAVGPWPPAAEGELER